MNKILILAAAPALALAAPVLAADPQGAANAASAASLAGTSSSIGAPTEANAPKAREKTYCMMVEASTGSRMRQQKCRTKEEWLNLGVDVTQKQ